MYRHRATSCCFWCSPILELQAGDPRQGEGRQLRGGMQGTGPSSGAGRCQRDHSAPSPPARFSIQGPCRQLRDPAKWAPVLINSRANVDTLTARGLSGAKVAAEPSGGGWHAVLTGEEGEACGAMQGRYFLCTTGPSSSLSVHGLCCAPILSRRTEQRERTARAMEDGPTLRAAAVPSSHMLVCSSKPRSDDGR